MLHARAVSKRYRLDRSITIWPDIHAICIDILNGISLLVLAVWLMKSIGMQSAGLILLAIVIANIPLRMIVPIGATCTIYRYRPVFPALGVWLFLPAVWIVDRYGVLDSGNTLALLLGWFLMSLTFATWRYLRCRSGSLSGLDAAVLGTGLTTSASRNADLLILPFLFSLSQISVYLLARSCALWVPLAMNVLKFWGFNDSALSDASGIGYRAHIARFNLSVFLVGSGVAVIILGLGKTLDGDVFVGGVLIWLLSRYALPAFFGVYEEVLKENGQGAILCFFHAGSFVALLMICRFSNVDEVVEFAKAVAFVNFVHALLCTFVLIQKFRIWPGPTALFFVRIRLG